MYSPPKEPIPAYGSSRSTGGFLRGCALGNTFNIADAEQVWGEVNQSDEPVKGKIYLYISDLNPAVVDISQSSFIANVYDIAKCQTVQDVMKRGSRDYSPIRRPAYRLFIHDEDDWCAQGRYESIISRTSTAEDYIKWTKDENNKYFIRILGTTFDPSSSLYLPGFAGRSSSLGSRSASGSRLDSYTPVSQMPTFQQGSSNPFGFTGRNMSAALRDRLVEELGIDGYFTNRTKTGIHFCWGRYLAITKAIEQAQVTSKAGSWPSDLPAFNDVLIVEVFISKSAWYNQKNNFALVQKHYPGMVEWLDQDISDQNEDVEVWGEYRDKYTLEDLKEYLDFGGKLKRSRMGSRARSSDDDRLPNKGKGKSHKKKYN